MTSADQQPHRCDDEIAQLLYQLPLQVKEKQNKDRKGGREDESREEQGGAGDRVWSRPRHASLVWRCGSSEIDSGGWADTVYADLHPDRWLCCAVLFCAAVCFGTPVLFCFVLLCCLFPIRIVEY